MTYTEAVKEGFRLANRNWQLVLIQLGMVFVSSISFFIIVGIPLAIAFIIFGIDLTGLSSLRDLVSVLKSPSQIISKYLGFILIVLACFLFYVIMVALLGIYVLGGAIGIIGESIKDRDLKFNMRSFFSEARRLFLRILGFSSVIGVIFIIVAFFIGILGGGIAALISFSRAQESTLILFFATFFSLILIVIALIIIVGILSITLYGFASLFFKDSGPLKSIHESMSFLVRHPQAFWLYIVLSLGYLLASFLIILLSYPFTIIPIIGTVISFPYQLLSYAVETYLGLFVIATIMCYYYSLTFASKVAPEVAQDTSQGMPQGESPQPEGLSDIRE
jgi:hypothetical protein